MLSSFVGTVLALLLIPFDFTYFLRLALLVVVTYLKKDLINEKGLTKERLLEPYICYGVVLPSDVHLNLEMNRFRCLSMFDYGRIGMSMSLGFRKMQEKYKDFYMVVNANIIDYRQPLHLFQWFRTVTRVLCWDEKSLYLEQKLLVRGNIVAVLMIVKMAVRGVSVHSMLEHLCHEPISSPPIPARVEGLTNYINQSSQKLREEYQQR